MEATTARSNQRDPGGKPLEIYEDDFEEGRVNRAHRKRHGVGVYTLHRVLRRWHRNTPSPYRKMGIGNGPHYKPHVKLGTDHSPQTEMPKPSTIVVCTPYRHQEQKAPLTHPAGLSPAMTFYAGKIQVEDIVKNRPWTTFIHLMLFSSAIRSMYVKRRRHATTFVCRVRTIRETSRAILSHRSKGSPGRGR